MRIERRIFYTYPVGQKFCQNRSILHGLGDTSNFKFYHFYSKIQNGRHFWKEKFFLKIEQSILHIYTAGQKFGPNRSILHGLGDTSNFKFYHFYSKIQNGRHFWKEKFFLKIEQNILHIYPVGQKFHGNR